MLGELGRGRLERAESGASRRAMMLGVPLRTAVLGLLVLVVLVLGVGAPCFGQKIAHPFPKRLDSAEFPRGLDWINTDKPVKLKDLEGKFVLLDFWTYCCINCIQTLPELKKMEAAYPNELVVIGVHSGKFDGEKDSENIEGAVLREGIEHPVVNDADQKIWDAFNVSSWPTLVLIDPAGKVVGMKSGETKFELIDSVLKNAIPYYEQEKLLDRTPIKWDLLADKKEATPLKFPGKVHADAAGKRLFITDTAHHRIVVTDLNGKLIETIGAGKEGSEDGDFATARFKKPQGVALLGESLYVADTENHLIRKVDLAKKVVTTMAGTGVQSAMPFPGVTEETTLATLPKRFQGPALETALASPWALEIHDGQIYIAMAGPHQIWRMPVEGETIELFAGNAAEDIVDGALLPVRPYERGTSSFAQPSGLASDGTSLFVVDSEGASIRSLPLSGKGLVTTLVGTNKLPYNRLFSFGDEDGPAAKAKFQHPTCVAYADGVLYVADTYNNKIRKLDSKTGKTETLAGSGQKETDVLDEPMGVSVAEGIVYVADTNKHRIRKIDLQSKAISTLEIEGLTPPAK